jgi:hypothetical protein
MSEKIVKLYTPKREVILHYDEIILILKTEVSKTAGSFLGLSYKHESPQNINFLNETSLIMPQEGLSFTVVENPIIPEK